MFPSILLPLAATAAAAANIWISFGDSYSQTGFNSTSGTLPSASNPLGNPPYPGYTATGGPNYIGLLTTKYNKSLILNYNFAYGGATIDAKLVQPYQSTVLSLIDQVNLYTNLQSKQLSGKIDNTTLFSIWIGVNDIGNSYGKGGGSAFNTRLVDAYFTLVAKLYATGARNFLFFNVPAIDRSPLMLRQSASDRANERTAINDFNKQVLAAIDKFKSTNAGVSTWVWDADASFTRILDAPKDYGFTDATSYGQSGSFWGNDYHPGSGAYEVFTKEIAAVLKTAIW